MLIKNEAISMVETTYIITVLITEFHFIR